MLVYLKNIVYACGELKNYIKNGSTPSIKIILSIYGMILPSTLKVNNLIPYGKVCVTHDFDRYTIFKVYIHTI